MKKVFFLMLSISLLFVSCKKDDSNEEKEEVISDRELLIGVWENSKYGRIEDGKETIGDYEHDQKCQKDNYEFISNGVSVLNVHFYLNSEEQCFSINDTGTWNMEDKVLTIEDLGEVNIYDVVTLNKTTLKIVQQKPSLGRLYRNVFEYIKR